MNISQRTRTLITTTALLVAGTITLAGCTSTGTDADIDPTQATQSVIEGIGQAAQSAHPVATETPTAKPAPADPAEGLDAGATIDAATAEEINTSWGTYNDDKAYQMADGSYVLVKGGEPVPEAVTADANASLVELGATAASFGSYTTDGGAAAGAAMQAVAAAANDKALAAGKKAVVVMNSAGNWAPFHTDDPYAGGLFTDYPVTLEASIAIAEAWVAQSPETRTYFVAGS